MNKIGFCTGFATTPLWQIDDLLIKKIAIAKYDYIEFPLMSIVKLNDKKYRKLLTLLKEIQIETPVMCNLFPSSIIFFNGFRDYDILSNYLNFAFQRCKDLKTKIVIFGSGKARSKGSLSLREANKQFDEIINKIVLTQCQKYDIKILLEPLSYSECDFINTVSEASKIVNRINSPYLGLMCDLSHMYNNKESLKSFESNLRYIEHIHISNKQRTLPEVKFDTYIEKALNILKRKRYDKRISFESNDGNVIQALYLIKHYLKE